MQYKDDIYPYDTKLIEAMQLYPSQFDNELIDFIRDIATYNLDISEVFENLKINKKYKIFSQIALPYSLLGYLINLYGF